MGPDSVIGGEAFVTKSVVLLNRLSNRVSLSLITSLRFFSPAPGLI